MDFLPPLEADLLDLLADLLDLADLVDRPDLADLATDATDARWWWRAPSSDVDPPVPLACRAHGCDLQ